MEDRLYILITNKADSSVIRRVMYLRAATLKAAWRKAEAHPMLRGWKIRNIQPCTYGRVGGRYILEETVMMDYKNKTRRACI